MQALEASNATEKEKQEEADRLKAEEHKSLLEMNDKKLAEEEVARVAQRFKAEEALQEATQSMRAAEVEVAETGAREKALSALRDLKVRAEEDLNAREVRRMKDMHAKLEEKRAKDEGAAKATGKEKLQERLAAKKAKKVAELALKEKKELTDLMEKQKKDEGERDRLKQARTVWTERLQVAMDHADEEKLNLSERENYCLQETLAKGLVPETHLNEAAGRVQGNRHRDEMHLLLSTHFEERVAAIRGAVQGVLEEKAVARNELLMRVTKDTDMSDDERKALSADLEKEFNSKQLLAEKNVTGGLEQFHMKQQMNLKQKQLEATAHVASLYMDPDSAARMISSSTKSIVEEMAEYRAKLEVEKKLREEQSIKERHEAELKLRDQMAAEMDEMRSKLLEDQELAAKEKEEKKNNVLKQREELEKKQLNDKRDLDVLEKSRILTDFEREKKLSIEAAAAAQQHQKSKLADRLAAKRKIKLSNEPVVEKVPTPENTSLDEAKDKMDGWNLIRKKSVGGGDSLKKRRDSATPSMQLIEDKLERIERMIVAIEVKTAAVAAPQEAPVTPESSKVTPTKTYEPSSSYKGKTNI
jgi:hypothetical protein